LTLYVTYCIIIIKKYKLNKRELVSMAKFHDTFTEVGRKKAEEIAQRINELGGRARIDVTYLDYGQDWTWETLIVYFKKLNMEYQALSPRDFEQMNEGKLSEERVEEIVAEGLR
jgi:hypothetical protein